MTIEETIRIALEAHDGQKDLEGNPAILHVLAVGLMGETELEQKVGFLHDVVEDSDISIDELRARGVEEEVLEAVDLLTIRRVSAMKSMSGISSARGIKRPFRSRSTTSIRTASVWRRRSGPSSTQRNWIPRGLTCTRRLIGDIPGLCIFSIQTAGLSPPPVNYAYG